MGKNALLEYVGGAIALIKDFDTSKENEFFNIRKMLYTTSYQDLDYKALSQEIKELRKPYEY